MRKLCCILLSAALIGGAVFLFQAQQQTAMRQEAMRREHFRTHLEAMAGFVRNSVLPILRSYDDDFTESELKLYRDALGNVILAVDYFRADMEKIEFAYDENAAFSKAVESFYGLLKAIQDKAGTLDEDVVNDISDIIDEPIRQLQRAFYDIPDLQDFFTFGSGLIDEMNQAIRALSP